MITVFKYFLYHLISSVDALCWYKSDILMIKKEARLVKIMAFSKFLFQNGKIRKEENSMVSDLSTCKPELHVRPALTKLSLKKALRHK